LASLKQKREAQAKRLSQLQKEIKAAEEKLQRMKAEAEENN